MTVDPVDETEAARLLGVPQAAVRQLADDESNFPSPTSSSGVPTWDRAALKAWAHRHRDQLDQAKARHDT